VGDEANILDQAIGQIHDEALRARIAREVELLRGSRRFGLVFDRHLPESVRLPDHPVRKGVTVTLRDESTTASWRVLRFTDTTRTVAVLDGDGGDGGEVPTDRLVVLREFGEPVYPGLRSVERIARGPADAPWHVVINGENFHVLQALRATQRGKVDLIYIDPPYNTGNDGWIYNDRYVDTNDRAKSSKWLSFLERRLLLARDLLKPTGVIIVAIGDDVRDTGAVEEPAQHQHRVAVTAQRAAALPRAALDPLASKKAGQERDGGLPDRERGGVADRIGHAGPRRESIFGRTASPAEVPRPTRSSPHARRVAAQAAQLRYWERLTDHPVPAGQGSRLVVAAEVTDR